MGLSNLHGSLFWVGHYLIVTWEELADWILPSLQLAWTVQQVYGVVSTALQHLSHLT